MSLNLYLREKEGVETFFFPQKLNTSGAEEFRQNYVRSAATSVDKLKIHHNVLTYFCVESVQFKDKISTHSTQNYIGIGGEFSNLSTLVAADLTYLASN